MNLENQAQQIFFSYDIKRINYLLSSLFKIVCKQIIRKYFCTVKVSIYKLKHALKNILH
jgi:hypothetical protein